MKRPPDPDHITVPQWLAAAVVWTAVLYGLLAPATQERDVRLAQLSTACAGGPD